MVNYYKYLPVSDEDQNWGLHVLNAGCNRIHKSAIYPEPQHPSHHYFRWEQGRVFNEYQVIYISKGEGLFESESCALTKITEGTIILLFPDEWHRFKPNPETGWDEFWVGFEGEIVQNLIRQNFFSPNKPILQAGIREDIYNLLSGIIEKTKTEKPGYQPAISGTVLHLLGDVYSLTKQADFKQENISEAIINKAIFILRSNALKNFSIEDVADELEVSYSWLRKTFKLYTGIAPGQYLLQLKINKAKMLLDENRKSIKEIAFETGFESAFYFSKIFKTKTGICPESYRKKQQDRFSADKI